MCWSLEIDYKRCSFYDVFCLFFDDILDDFLTMFASSDTLREAELLSCVSPCLCVRACQNVDILMIFGPPGVLKTSLRLWLAITPNEILSTGGGLRIVQDETKARNNSQLIYSNFGTMLRNDSQIIKFNNSGCH